MISSGIKRGLATSAVSALAVAGLPLLASSANAVPLSTTVGVDAVKFYSQNTLGISDKNDGSNTTVSLVTGGGTNVTSVLYQYESSTALGTWVDVPGGLVARNADGVFAFDWAGVPETVTSVRAVPNTGVANAVVAAAPNVADAAANTVELGSEGALGVFQSPYTEASHTGDYVGVTGTVSDGTTAVTVKDVSNTGHTGAANVDTEADTFDAVVDIDGYPYSGGTEANQIALNAATNNTDDAEASTLYVQKIGQITAAPATQEVSNPNNSEIVIRVFDTTGKPVAGAQVYKSNPDTDTDGAGPDTDTDGADQLIGYTDGYGELIDDTQTTAGTFTYFVNTTDVDAYEPAVDKSTTATVTTYSPTLAEVDIVNNLNRPNFDLDELGDGDDFTIVTKDQRGKAIDENIAGPDVEYRWVIDPNAVGDTFTSAWLPGETDANGKFAVPGLTDTSFNGGALPEGTYTLEARRPNVSGAGLHQRHPGDVLGLRVGDHLRRGCCGQRAGQR